MPRWDVHFNMGVKLTDPTIVQRVAEARALASVIRGIPIPPYLQNRLDSLNIIRAVRGTTGIEGAELSEEEVGKVLQAPRGQRVLTPSRAREEQEVRNAEELMVYVAKYVNRWPDAPLTEDLIRRFHKLITRGIDYPRNTPGQYRNFPVRAGGYVPPESGDEVQRLMTEFVNWFNKGTPTNWDPVIRALVAHFYVISIHPFGDGNGRASRAVESYLLYQAGVNARGFYSLANYYYRQRPEYVAHLDYVRFQSDPDLTPFISFALKGLVEELRTVHEEVLAEVQLISFRDFARETLSRAGKLGTPVGERQFMFLLGLTAEPVSLKDLRSRRHPLSAIYSDVTTKTFMRDINFLRKEELVVITGDELRANLDIMTRFTAEVPARRRLLRATRRT